MSATVLVTDASRGSAISVIRSLGRRGITVVAADSDPRSPGFYSRYTSRRLVYPAPDRAPDAMAETLLRAARELPVDLIVPVTDETILPLEASRERFEEVCTLALPDPKALETTSSKVETLALARKLGVPTPRTAVVETAAEAVEQAAVLGWPVVLKPQQSRLYRDQAPIESLSVAYAGGFARLGEHMSQFEGRCPVLLQEYYRGEAHGVELLLSKGEPVAAFQHRRLREVPFTGGASSFRESVPLDPVLYEHSVRLLAELRWTGLAMVEFKLGEEGPKLMEINGRIWGSLPLAVKSGVDFPGLMADVHLPGASPNGRPPIGSYRIGVRSRNLELEVVWIASVLRGERRYPFLRAPRRREAFRTAVALLNARDGFDILSREDVRPGLADLVKVAGKLSRKVVHAR